MLKRKRLNSREKATFQRLLSERAYMCSFVDADGDSYKSVDVYDVSQCRVSLVGNFSTPRAAYRSIFNVNV